MWTATPLEQCPACSYNIAPELRQHASFCPRCRFPLLVLAGKYHLLEMLGEGGSGKVYLARHAGLTQASERVVKVLDEQDMTAGQIERFHREVQLTARVSLTNEHIVRIFDDFGFEPNFGYFYVMEYLQGQSLGQRLNQDGRIPINKAMEWFGQLCEAMSAAHRSGIIHRDLKPDNILLINRPPIDDFLKVIDFGIAKPTESGHEITDNPVGTPFYMSPEQCLGQALDTRSDIYAMGLIFYEMLTGSDPFGIRSIRSEEELLTVVFAQIHEAPKPLHEIAPDLDLPDTLDKAIAKALSKKPSDRYATVEAFWHHVTEAMGYPIDASTSAHALSLLHMQQSFETLLAQHNQTYSNQEAFTLPSVEGVPSEDQIDLNVVSLGSTELPAPTVAMDSFSLDAISLENFSANVSPVEAKPTEWGMPSFHDFQLSTRIAVGPTLHSVESVNPTVPTMAPWSEVPVAPVNPGNISALHLPANRFVGRSNEWSQLDLLWEQGARLITLLGPGGVGKTRLARQYAQYQREQQRWPGGVWYCDLNFTSSFWEVLETMAQTLQVEIPHTTTLHGALSSMGKIIRSHGPSLWVFDHLDQLIKFSHDTLGSWIELAPQASFMATTRQRLRLGSEAVVEMEPLHHDEAIELFADRASSWMSLRLDTEEYHLVSDLVARLDGNPLAIELAASRLHVMSLQELLERLTQRMDVLQQHHPSQAHHHVTFRDTLDWSWQMLEPNEREALAQCSMFENGFTLQAAEEIIRTHSWPNGPSVVNVISSLRDQSLLRLHSSSTGRNLRFTMYNMLRNYAAEKLVEMGRFEEVSRRHAAFYLAWGKEQTQSLDREEGAVAYEELLLEADNIRAIYHRYLQLDTNLALQAHLLLYPTLRTLGGTEEYLQQLHYALKLEGVLESKVRLQALQVQAECMRRLGQVQKAQNTLESALAMAYTNNNPNSKGQLLNRLGNFYRQQGHYEQAETMHREALVLSRQNDDIQTTSVTLSHLGNVFRLRGRLDEAERLYREALQIHRNNRDKRGEGIVYSQLGNLYRSQGRIEEAIDAFDEALQIQRNLGDRRGESITLSNLGQVKQKQGWLQDAERSYQQAMEIYRTTGDRRGESITLDRIGELQQLRGRYKEASSLHAQALVLYRQLNDRRGEGFCLHNIARIFRLQGSWEETLQHLQHAISLHNSIQDNSGIGVGLYELGLTMLEMQNYEKAYHYLHQALGHVRHYHRKAMEGELLLTLCTLHHLQYDLDAALHYTQEALQLATELGDRPLEVMSLSALIAVSADMEKFEKAHAAKTTAEQQVENQKNPTLQLAVAIGAAHLEWSLSQQAKFQQQSEIGQQYYESAIHTWNHAAGQINHAFPKPLTMTTPYPSPDIAATDLLRLSLRRLQHTLFSRQSQPSTF